MKLSTLTGTVTVTHEVKLFAMVLSILDKMYSGDRVQMIRCIARYYDVTL